LLLSRKPVESRPEPGPLLPVTRHEPQAPEHLIAALPATEAEEKAVQRTQHPSPSTVPTSLQNEEEEP
jgi:hypothetical protein